MDAGSVYLLRPWTAQYGSIATTLAEPDAASLPAMMTKASTQYSKQAAFTTVMPNGMFGNLSYAQVDELSDAFAGYLRDVLQVPAGSRVAIQMPNCLAYPVVLLGTLKAACVAVNTNPLYTANELRHQFCDSGATVVVAVDMFADRLEACLPDCSSVKHVVLTKVSEFFPTPVSHLVHAIQKYWHKQIPKCAIEHCALPEAIAQGHRALKGHAARRYWDKLSHADLALLQYTGGTTGTAKGAMLTHGNLLWNVCQLRAMLDSHIQPGREVVLTALPLYHIFAFTVNLLAMFEAGARNILVPSPRPIQNLQRAFENYPITWVTGVNTLYNALLAEEWFTAFPPKFLKAAGGGGAAMHSAVVERFERLTGAPLIEGYGLTESSPVVCFQPLHRRQRDSIGIPIPMTDVKLVDDSGGEVPIGQPGELLVRGPQVMAGYWKQPESTDAAVRDGWLCTGDIATMDNQGTFRIVDRKKDLILVSGFNVYPNEVEDALTRHPKVLEAGVIGLPHAKTGEAVYAYVVRLDPEVTQVELLAHCRTLLSGYKVPVRIVFRDELPKSTVGKVLRKELRASASGTGAGEPEHA
ncbi:MAG: AMP-binding protein [Polaromonas sp.]|nr:AMP-binding protein [Polaromonas sp.]